MEVYILEPPKYQLFKPHPNHQNVIHTLVVLIDSFFIYSNFITIFDPKDLDRHHFYICCCGCHQCWHVLQLLVILPLDSSHVILDPDS